MIELKPQLLSKVCCYSVRLTTRILILTLLIFPVQSCTNHSMNNGCSNQIAFVSEDADGKNSDIYLVNLDGSGLKNLTNSSAYETTPSWSPDGQKIAFSSNRDGNSEIYVMNFDGSNISRLTQTQQGMNYSPAWSPDGKKLLLSQSKITILKFIPLI